MSEIPPKTLKQMNILIDRIQEVYEIAFSSIFEKSFTKSNLAIKKNKELLGFSIPIKNVTRKEEEKQQLYLLSNKFSSVIRFIEEVAEIGLDSA